MKSILFYGFIPKRSSGPQEIQSA